MRQRISFEDAVEQGLIAVGKPIPRAVFEGFKFINFGEQEMKKKEIIEKLLVFVGNVADQLNEHEFKPFNEYVDDIDELCLRAQDLLEEIENA